MKYLLNCVPSKGIKSKIFTGYPYIFYRVVRFIKKSLNFKIGFPMLKGLVTCNKEEALVGSVDLRNICPSPYDQGPLGSCTGFAIAKGLLESLRIKSGLSPVPMSALFVYYEERLSEGDVDVDAGANISDGISIIKNMGCASDKTDPYDVKNFRNPPTKEAIIEASHFKVKNTFRLSGLSDVKHCLSDGYPLVIGIQAFNSINSEKAWKTGVVDLPTEGEKPEGGHAITLVGFSDEKKHFIFRNSWSKSWGDEGYGYLSYDYVQKYGYDFFTARLS